MLEISGTLIILQGKVIRIEPGCVVSLVKKVQEGAATPIPGSVGDKISSNRRIPLISSSGEMMSPLPRDILLLHDARDAVSCIAPCTAHALGTVPTVGVGKQRRATMGPWGMNEKAAPIT